MAKKSRQSKISFGGSTSNTPAKDPAWEHCEAVDPGKRRHVLKCNYCGIDFSGGVYRIKNHLAHTRKAVGPCKKVPPEVKQFFITYLKNFENGKEKCEESGALDGEDELEGKEKLMKDAFDRTKTPNTINSYYKKPGRDDACIAICDFFYANAVPFNAVNNIYFKKMVNVIGEFGKGLKPLSMHEVRVTILKKKVEYVQGTLAEYKQEWKRTGCTLMSDGWTDKKQRSITNFLVNSPRGTVFLKSIDTSDIQHNAQNLFELLDVVVVDLGEENVVQVINDGALAYAVC